MMSKDLLTTPLISTCREEPLWRILLLCGPRVSPWTMKIQVKIMMPLSLPKHLGESGGDMSLPFKLKSCRLQGRLD